MYKSNKILVVLVVILSILIVGLIGFVVYDKSLNKNKENQNNDNNITNSDNNITNSDNDTTEDNKEMLQDIEKKYLSILYGIDSLQQISNQKLLYNIVINSALNLEPTFTKIDLEHVLESTIYRNMKINHEDIWLYGEENSDVVPKYNYNKENETYKSNPIGKGHCEVKPNILKVVDYTEENGKYTIKYKYGFYYGCEGGIGKKIYGSYNDALNQNSNYVFEADLNSIESGVDPYEQVKKILEDNYNSYADKLDTYTYVFEKTDNQFVIIDFYIN